MSSFENVSEKPAMASESSIPEPLFSTKTPDKTTILPTRSRNSDVSLSFPDIKPQGSRYPIKPVKRQLLASPQKPEITIKLPERIFSYDHLAQMKHIYPEAIEIKRVLKCDEDTSCMNPSLHVKLNTDAIVPEDANCGTKHMQLRKVFHSKLVDFYKAHPKDEIPKELLPEPFNSSKRDSCSDTISVDLGASKLENEGFDIQMEEMEKEQHRVDKVVPDSTLLFGTEECLLSHTESRIVGTPVKDLSTPSRDLSTPIRLMSATPTLQPSRRCITMTPPDDDNDSIRSTNGLERRSSRTKCLNFDTLEEDGTAKAGDISNVSYDEGINYEADDVSDEESLVHSMKEKPKPETEKQDLPKLVNLIHKLFHATKRTIITKEELLHKIIACQINITDTSREQLHRMFYNFLLHRLTVSFLFFFSEEVEEQYRLMLQLVPDWISETKASSGHFLVRINKMSTAETVCARLDEATSQGISSVY
ncbi:hypothetical protein EUTSA_v10010331mg [Eutrema salsugineum]|uniref:CDT1 Geminin-binding domain-containing protein n=1 Tax=Eutrema salsugineum TaxID=72664 RepID=V4LYN0_EUTSA|nr:hypothetical protein EUTSA_v10010331mg [Eutrema salsugineum]